MNDELCCNSFNFRVLDNLYKTGFCDGQMLCVGVSGGADSICLLTSLAFGFEQKKVNQKIFVFTVDHKIRSKEESFGDCKFVQNYCEQLNQKLSFVKINCELCELKKGQVFYEAEIRKRGVEEAARFLRYKIFEEKALSLMTLQNENTIFFALAHNENDQLETLIMRFLSGSDSSSRGGIAKIRSVKFANEKSINYIRPLLSTSRNQIEEYLNKQNILWRTDNTNFNNDYLRNKIRNSIIPVLDKTVPGWKTAVISGSEKAFYENSFIEKSVSGIDWVKSEDGFCIDKSVFENLDFVQKQRLLYKAIDCIDSNCRMPFSFVKSICLENYFQCKNGIEVLIIDEKLWIKKSKKKATINGFFVIIEKSGFYDFDFGRLIVKDNGDGFSNLEFVTKEEKNYYLNNVPLPFAFRSRQLLDWVLTKSKSKKSVSDVLSDFKVDVNYKNQIPIIEQLCNDGKKNIIAIWGNIFGYKNWIV